jgi:hypothetical protein
MPSFEAGGKSIKLSNEKKRIQEFFESAERKGRTKGRDKRGVPISCIRKVAQHM